MRQLKEGLLDKRNIRNIKNDDKIWIIANFDDSMDLEKSSKLHYLRTNDYVDLYIGYKKDFIKYSKDLKDMSVTFYEVYDKIDMEDVLKRLNGITWFNNTGVVLRRTMESKKLCMKMEFEDLFEGLLNKTNIHNIGDDETWFLCLSTSYAPIFSENEYIIYSNTYTYWLFDKKSFLNNIYNTHLRRDFKGYLFAYSGKINKDKLVKSVEGSNFISDLNKEVGYFTRIKMEDVKKWV